MKQILLAVLVLLAPLSVAVASGDDVHLDSANIDPTNEYSLQRGARTFVNYCLGCHAAAYQRYNRLAADLGLSEESVMENLMFTGEKIGDHMKVSVQKADIANWFGAPPPDLTLVARVRGVDWLYTYMRSFYLDDKRPFGVNNVAFPNVGMPHVLWELQGWQKPVNRTITEADGREHTEIESLDLAKQGSQSPAEYDRTVRDLVNFLAYMSEPVKLERQALGIKVLLFLLVFLVVAYLLKKEYWKDVH